MALVVTVSSLVLLITGSSLLTLNLNPEGNLPLGTFITWAGMIALPFTIYWGNKKLRKPIHKVDKILSTLLLALLILGWLWAPISYVLAGNWSFTFSEREAFQGGQTAMQWFWRLSYGIGLGSVLVLVLHWVSKFFR